MKIKIHNLTSVFKLNYLLVLLFALIIGFSERFIGSLHMPYGSVVLNTIIILVLSIARIVVPKKGTSLLIVSIAILFKIYSLGLSNCTTNVLLGGPAALMMIGLFYEIFANVLTSDTFFRYTDFLIVCILTVYAAFSVFGFMNIFILKTWDTSRLMQYIFIRGTITAIVSGIFSLIGIFFVKTFKDENFIRHNPNESNEFMG